MAIIVGIPHFQTHPCGRPISKALVVDPLHHRSAGGQRHVPATRISQRSVWRGLPGDFGWTDSGYPQKWKAIRNGHPMVTLWFNGDLMA